ncbi:GNAT family N-acetyltransferase [Sphingomonas asaccharolytica]|uniref:GNAT family N-acetyltransferase n=1 Tax=Sphingomonas asaccharolytica TaxID=40681 RepID=UPI0008361064|nr:N-acetyltransferase [Sphingomonas asaccharolytica]
MIEYRDATPADGNALDAMAQAIWIETFAHGVSVEDAATYLAEAYGSNGKLLADLSSGAARFHLALADGRVVGYAKINPPWLPDAEPGALQLSQIYVSSDQHGAGVGKALLNWAIATARAQGATALLLTVWEENHRAAAFYRKHGFEHVGDYAFAVGTQIDTDHIMRLAL